MTTAIEFNNISKNIVLLASCRYMKTSLVFKG